MRSSSIIDIVEAAYRLDVDEADWLQGVAETARLHLDAGLGILGYRFHVPQAGPPRTWGYVGAGVPGDYLQLSRSLNDQLDAESARSLFMASPCFRLGEVFANVGMHDKEALFRDTTSSTGFVDVFAITARDTTATGSALCVPLPPRSAPPADFAVWSRVAAHIAAASRIREGLREEGFTSPLLDDAQAILTPDGRIDHLAKEGVSPSAQLALQVAARKVDAARGRMRWQDPQEALALWGALFSGRWSLVDWFDTDGRRFVVARENEPAAIGPRRLTRRERQVAGLAAHGHANKLIAYELGLSVPSVATYLKRALKKLGVATRVELATLFSQLGAPVLPDGPPPHPGPQSGGSEEPGTSLS